MNKNIHFTVKDLLSPGILCGIGDEKVNKQGSKATIGDKISLETPP